MHGSLPRVYRDRLAVVMRTLQSEDVIAPIVTRLSTMSVAVAGLFSVIVHLTERCMSTLVVPACRRFQPGRVCGRSSTQRFRSRPAPQPAAPWCAWTDAILPIHVPVYIFIHLKAGPRASAAAISGAVAHATCMVCMPHNQKNVYCHSNC